jgi:hypothetical protein
VPPDGRPPGSSDRRDHLPIPPPPGAPRAPGRPTLPPPGAPHQPAGPADPAPRPPRVVGQPGHLLPARPLSFGDTVEGVLRLSARIFWRTALLVLLVIGPYQLLSSYLVARVVPESFTPGDLFGEQPTLVPADVLERFGVWTVVLQVLGLLVHLVVLTAAVAFVLQDDRGERPSTRDALRLASDRSGATVGGSVLLLGASLLLLVLVLPAAVVLAAVPVVGPVVGLVLGLAVTAAIAGGSLLVVPVAAVEDRGAWTTFRRVLWVVRGRFRRLLGTVGLVVLAFVVALLVSIPLLVLTAAVGPPGWLVDGLISTLVTAIGLPVVAVAGLLVHHDALQRAAGQRPPGPRDGARPRSG